MIKKFGILAVAGLLAAAIAIFGYFGVTLTTLLVFGGLVVAVAFVGLRLVNNYFRDLF